MSAPNSIPLSWVDKIFRELHGRFGQNFLGQFATGQTTPDGDDTGVLNAKRVWAKTLTRAGVTVAQIEQGLWATYPRPPSCDAFLQACQPETAVLADSEALFHRAAAELRKRRAHQPQHWPNPALFWAAMSIGGDLLVQDYRTLRGRWEAALAEARRDVAPRPIPEVEPEHALPPPPWRREEAQRRVSELHLSRFGSTTNGKAHWLRVAAQPERYPQLTRQYAYEALTRLGIAIPTGLSRYFPHAE
ncbi:hypothetical protein OL229_16125 [Neisseriaceae bacterium JH1-16]|nr:hypothetical protein [Neisseriaceae bacterium JH1-16]